MTTYENNDYRAQIVCIPQRSWRWGHRAELRVRTAADSRPLSGHGYRDGLIACYEVDTRYDGPRSYLGKLLAHYGF